MARGLQVVVAYSPLIKRHKQFIILRMITEEVGKRIKALRNQAGISQEKFAYSIGMDRTYFASVESGKRNISIINLEKIANGFGINLSTLLKGI